MSSKILFYRVFLTLSITIVSINCAHASHPIERINDLSAFQIDATHPSLNKKEINRIKRNAILLAITLGPFGVHRLYLGTNAKVPLAYTLTFGGGLGILVVADIIAIATTKDLEKMLNNEHFILLNG